MKKLHILNCLIVLFFSCTSSEEKSEKIKSNPTIKVILSSEIEWEKLNPARGDKSPQAGTIWGDRKGEVPTGFLAKFVDGFSSPPHIHNETYRAVVLQGLIHNDDANAENMWMKPGSFWTQPQGEAHITSAQGTETMALVEIDQGPYLVQPIEEAFDNGERPINIDVSNLIWLDNSRSAWIQKSSEAQISFLSENGDMKSLFIKLPKNCQQSIETTGSVLHAVVVSGEVNYFLPQTENKKSLDMGSYFGSRDRAFHLLSNDSPTEVILYIRTNGAVIMN